MTIMLSLGELCCGSMLQRWALAAIWIDNVKLELVTAVSEDKANQRAIMLGLWLDQLGRSACSAQLSLIGSYRCTMENDIAVLKRLELEGSESTIICDCRNAAA